MLPYIFFANILMLAKPQSHLPNLTLKLSSYVNCCVMFGILQNLSPFYYCTADNYSQICNYAILQRTSQKGHL